ncbi:MAG: Stk1 family PASTA domain-containing Ser/Thr kinase [Clostridia bacterium]|nr:Stk1 family PASTA domain-containing Ser/Thr kinase [Clostridia bacterium]
MDLQGKILGNRYEIIEKIGTGGMATVYRAKCHVLKREVAVKILRDEFTTDNEFIKRFNAEAQSAASLTHPNIVSVYDVGHEGNLYYIVMELVKGKTLKEIIVEDGALAWKWAVDLAIQIARGLEKAHRNNIIHRDIKPHNIIITEEGVAKVTDFGIAKAVSNSTITAFGATTGSVHYFSPEHAKGGHTDAKSDLYSLGVVMYEMVTGRVPFDADTPVSVALKHMQEEPVEPIVLNSQIPICLNKIILKAMQKEPSMRYQSATEMIRDLEMCLKDETGSFVKPFPDVDEFATKRISLNYNNEEKHAKKKEGKFAKIKKHFEKHPVQKWIAILLSCILVFVLTMCITFFALNMGKVKDVALPKFEGMTLEEAKIAANEAGIKVEIEEAFHVEIEEGKIISQDPIYQENYKVKEGSTVKLVVSKGQELVKVTKVVGKKRDEAIKELKDLGLVPEVEEVNSDEIEKDYVIEQDVAEGEEILKGSTIKIKVSMGIEQVEVPDLTGMTEEEAKQALTNAKLKWKSTSTVTDSSKGTGVVSQTVSPKSMVDKGTEVSITINTYSELKTGTITINVASIVDYTPETEENEEGETVTKDPETVELKVTVDGEQIESKKVSKDTTDLKVTTTGRGTVVVKVIIDGSTKRTKEFNLNTQTEITID